MKSVFQTFLNLLLVVSLSAAPVTAALATAGSGSGEPVIGAGSETAHATGLNQSPVSVYEKSPASAPCVSGDDGCICPDNAGCQHVTASTSPVLPAGLLEFATRASELPVTGLQENPVSLNLPPESPPPIA